MPVAGVRRAIPSVRSVGATWPDDVTDLPESSPVRIGRLRLDPGIDACLFDLDGVLTDTAALHASAWKKTFDPFLRARAAGSGRPFVPFDAVADYAAYLDGRLLLDGVRAFLESRGLEPPVGASGDDLGVATVRQLADTKTDLVRTMMEEKGVRVYPGSWRFLREVRRQGLRTAVVSSSANAGHVLDAAGIADLFDTRIDGAVAEGEHLRGKPAPDMYLAAATRLGVGPSDAAVFEDALAGVEAGRAGGFGFVVGVRRTGRAADLRSRGADVVVDDLAELIDD